MTTREELNELAGAYEDAFGVPLPTQPPLDFGHWRIPVDDLARYAREAIERGKPIDWREIVGPTLDERYGFDERGRPRAIS